MSLSLLLSRLTAPGPVPRRRKRLRPARFFVELLESRALLAAYTVNSTGPGLGGANVITLVEAIGLANAHPNDAGGTDVINFDIAGSGVQTISLIAALPTVTDPVVIDATTQPGYSGQPLIEIDGSQAGATDGLVFQVGGNTVAGLVINNFAGFGIVLDGSHDRDHGAGPGLNNIVQRNYIGTDFSGTQAASNGSGGINLVSTSFNLIGGLNTGEQLTQGNLISGNGQTGVFLSTQSDTNNYIEGNYIGTDVDGMKPLPAPGSAGTDGIFLGPSKSDPQAGFASGNYIGDYDPISKQFDPNGRNIIGGNLRNGIYILGGHGNLIAGNYVGIGSDGATPVANGGNGVRLEDASTNIVGGTLAGAGNVISANGQSGVAILADSTSQNFVSMPVSNQSTVSNVVQGNYIGTDSEGIATLLSTSDQSGNLVQVPLGNGKQGVVLANFASDPSVVVSLNLIGGDDSSDGTVDSTVMARNIISGNLDNGVLFDGPAVTSNLVLGNYIGTNKAGDAALANFHFGIVLNSIAGETGAPSNNSIGGIAAGAGNVIAGNGTSGAADGLPSGGVIFTNGSNGNFLENNDIGVDSKGLNPLPNIGNGVTIEGSANNVSNALPSRVLPWPTPIRFNCTLLFVAFWPETSTPAAVLAPIMFRYATSLPPTASPSKTAPRETSLAVRRPPVM